MPELRPLKLDDVRDICPQNYTSGLKYFRDGALSQTWRTAGTLHAAIAGSAREPYAASVGPRDDGSYAARCTCPAARRQPICKHATAVLVAWAEAPARFPLRAEPEAPAAGAASNLKVQSEVKRARQPKPDKRDLIAAGLDKAEALLVELCAQGLLAVSQEQVETVGALAETLGAHKLRRLARHAGEIRALAASARLGKERFDERDWGRLLAETWFVLAATRKALAKGEAAEPGELEELVGKTWLEKDLRRLAGLRLLELAYETDRRAAGFRIDVSYLLDLGDGTLYTEKQITPLQLRDVPKKSSYARPLRVATAGLYPGYAPHRLKLIESGEDEEAGNAWDLALSLAETSASALRARLTQATASLVAPQEVYSLFRPACFFLEGETIYLVDGENKSLAVGGGRAGTRAPGAGLKAALGRGPVAAVFCRARFAGQSLAMEPLGVIMQEGPAAERLVRLTA